MLKIIIINGYGGSGKDTFVELVKQNTNCKHVENISSIDPIKDLAISLGWDQEKNDKNRTMLSELKRVCNFYFGTSDKYVDEKVDEFTNSSDDNSDLFLLFIHVREKEEIRKYMLKYDAITLCITRPDIEIPTNDSDRQVMDFNYKFYVNNDKDIPTLRKKSESFVNILRNLSNDTIENINITI